MFWIARNLELEEWMVTGFAGQQRDELTVLQLIELHPIATSPGRTAGTELMG